MEGIRKRGDPDSGNRELRTANCELILRPLRLCAKSLLLCLLLSTGLAQQSQRQEESEDYYRKWLEEDVAYIITAEEKAVFKQLATNDERDEFIEQFWYRRDPDPRTPFNEFKQEHYRRLAYANEHFAAGFPGWRTDRGKTYIIHGPPDELTEYPSGGTYDRPLEEGGGQTAAYPFEIWRYRHIEGVGENIELQFVDRDGSNEYRLALSPDEKDAFLHIPTAGYTLAEQLGLATRLQRPYYSPGGSYPLMNYREQDSAFQRYERFVNVQRPPVIRYQDLKQIVKVDVTYTDLKFRSRADYFRLDENSMLVPITVQVDHNDMSFEQNGGNWSGKVAIYGVVTGLDNRIAAEFEDELEAAFPESEREAGMQRSSLYQKVVVLDPRMKYKLELVLKDLKSGHVGVAAQAVLVPPAEPDKLMADSLLLSDFIAPARQDAGAEEMFTLGDVTVRPKLDAAFPPQGYCALYTQLHNVAADQSTGRPYFRINYRVWQGGAKRLEEFDDKGTSVQYYSPNRLVLIKRLDLSNLEPGDYRAEVEFIDKIRGRKITRSTPLRVSQP